MKRRIRNLFRLPALAVGLSMILAGRMAAQTFTTVHSFTAGALTNSDGQNPVGRLTLSANTLYGTTYKGGDSGEGTVFKVNTDGSGFMTLHSFSAISGPFGPNSDGSSSQAGLLLMGNTLYGTAAYGGSSGGGTVFAVNTDGSGFATLHNFTYGTDGAWPLSDLILLGSTLYGTASDYGNAGTVFKLNTDGSGFTTLHSFTSTTGPLGTNSDGAYPQAGLTVAGNALYGTTQQGGSSGNGTIFAVSTNGSGFTNLHSLTYNGSAAEPGSLLVSSANVLYGTTYLGGVSGFGTVFRINADGTSFMTLYSFAGGSDGAYPQGGLTLAGNSLYGTTYNGGDSGGGTVFKVNTDGSGFTTLHSFTSTVGPLGTNSDGAYPQAGLTVAGNTLYGTTQQGGGYGAGTVFSLALGSIPAPQLAIAPYRLYVVLTWPTNGVAFSLQSSTNLVSPGWANVSPGPVVVNGQNTLTNPISGAGRFYRLSQ